MRAPHTLRTCDRAVTQEDFEALAVAGSGGAIARAYCLPTRPGTAQNSQPWQAAELLREIEREDRQQKSTAAGTRTLSEPLVERVKTYLGREGGPQERPGRVRLLLVPHPPRDSRSLDMGLSPELLALDPAILARTRAYLDERRLLGIEVLFDCPRYVGVSVRAELAPTPTYDSPDGRAEISRQIASALYRFLNPITGWIDGRGWPFGQAARVPDLIPLLQGITGVGYLGAIELFELQSDGGAWHKRRALDARVDPGPLGLICSWQDEASQLGHEIDFLPGVLGER